MKKLILVGLAACALTACGGDKPKKDEMIEACVVGGANAFASSQSAGSTCTCIVKKVRSKLSNAAVQQDVIDHWNSQRGRIAGTSFFSSSTENTKGFHAAHYISSCKISRMKMSNGDYR